jgi:hypothetical protein
MRVCLALVLATAASSCVVQLGSPSIGTGESGNLHRLRFDQRQLSRIEAEYPPEDLRFYRTGDAMVAFRLNNKGRIIESKPGGVYTSDAFYRAAVKVLEQLKLEYIEGSWSAPINYFVADVAFTVPQCLPAHPRMNTDLQITICASPDQRRKLAWESGMP